MSEREIKIIDSELITGRKQILMIEGALTSDIGHFASEQLEALYNAIGSELEAAQPTENPWVNVETAEPERIHVEGTIATHLFKFADGDYSCVYYDPYYDIGGAGYTPGELPWIEPCSGEPVSLHFGIFVEWMLLEPREDFAIVDRIAQLEAAQPTEEQIEAEITPEVFTAGRMAFQANARNSGGQKIRAVYKAMRLKSLQLTEGEE